MRELDIRMFRAVNRFAGKGKTLDAVGRFCAGPLIFVIAAGALYASRIVAIEVPGATLRTLTAVALAFLFDVAVGQMVQRRRPFEFLDRVTMLQNHPVTESSFPSVHSSAAFAFAFAAWTLVPAVGPALAVAATFVALGRVYVGVHFPSDALAGAIVGAAAAFAVAV